MLNVVLDISFSNQNVPRQLNIFNGMNRKKKKTRSVSSSLSLYFNYIEWRNDLIPRACDFSSVDYPLPWSNLKSFIYRALESLICVRIKKINNVKKEIEVESRLKNWKFEFFPPSFAFFSFPSRHWIRAIATCYSVRDARINLVHCEPEYPTFETITQRQMDRWMNVDVEKHRKLFFFFALHF